MMTTRRTCWLAVSACWIVGCGSGGGDNPSDRGMPDTLQVDTPVGPEDVGAEEVGTKDEGSIDLGQGLDVFDVRTVDTGEVEDPCSWGATGCPCKANEDCISNLCVDTMDGFRCSIGCQTSAVCPKGWYCGMLGGGGSDVVSGCIDPFSSLCQPCVKDQECVPAIASTDYKYVCVDFGVNGSFCGVSCKADDNCPDGFECAEALTEGGSVKQCRPAAGADCPCTLKYQQQANVTVCRVQNPEGVCRAERTCDQDCSAKVPEAETCNNVDDDCDGDTDENIPDEECTLTTGEWKCPAKNICTDGTMVCTGVEPVEEACNGKDDDCNGETDEEGALNCTQWVRDEDKDGYGVDGDEKCLCDPLAPYTATIGGDCDDTNKQVFTGAAEVCNGKDDDCDGETDEEGAQKCIQFYVDQDGDMFGLTTDTKCLCASEGLYSARVGEDCNDQLFAVNPGATETCNVKDDDCDGETDEEGALGAFPCTRYYLDSDRDKYGKSDVSKCLCAAVAPYDAGENPSGLPAGFDCNDDNKAVNPNAVERCNGLDDDCNGVTDDPGIALGGKQYFKDLDGDGRGSGKDYQVRCAPGEGYTSLTNTDCDDNDPNVYPGATEFCNGHDDNCDNAVDEDGASGCTPYYYDKDGDGYGLTLLVQCRCNGPNGFYRAVKDGDCNDNSSMIHPGVAEVCTDVSSGGIRVDEDCDGQTDEEGATNCINYFVDMDGDGHSPDPNNFKCLCTPKAPYTGTDATGDCCDQDANVHRGQANWFTSANVCGNFDYDCNGRPDKEYSNMVSCSWSFGCSANAGWTDSVPDCGGSGCWSNNCSGFPCSGDCDLTRTQRCK